MLRRKVRPALAVSVIQIKTKAIDWRKMRNGRPAAIRW
jgi:hypothetical protein